MNSEQLKKKLEKVTIASVDRFTLEGMKTYVKVISVHDGDTCDVAFYRGKELMRFTCRLKDVHAPELEDGEKAEFARDYLAHLCMGQKPETFDDTGTWRKKQLQNLLNENKKSVYAEFGEFEIYCRLEVTLKTSRNGRSINEMMEEYVQSLESESSDASEMDSSDN